MGEIRRVTAHIAAAVAREAGDCGAGWRIEEANLESVVAAAMWEPCYVAMDPAPVREEKLEPVLAGAHS